MSDQFQTTGSSDPKRDGSPPSLKLLVGQMSQQGQREINEDAYAHILPSTERARLNKGACAMISDGTGGDGTGRDASQFVQAKLFGEYYQTPDTWTVERSMSETLNNLNRWLYQKRSPGVSYLCTLSCLVMKGRSFTLFHVGDTRIYRWRSHKLERLTQDHHYPGHTARLVRAMGLDSVLRPDIETGDLEIGDLFIMTSDGVHGHLDDKTIRDVVIQQHTPQAIATELCRIGVTTGYGDNATAQVFEITDLPYPSRSEMLEEENYLKAAPELNPGDQLDGYKIIERLAIGGMAVIYRAEEIKSGREVAIKCPLPALMQKPVQLERFHREEWTGLRVHSPNLMHIYPPRPKRSQYYYIVMELCPGQSLRQKLSSPSPEARRFSVDQVLSIAQQIAKGMHFMHNLDIIHRDLKPENVILSNEGQVKIVDYGIVRLSGLAQLNSDDEVRSLIGSPYYMAPEFFSEGSRGTVQTDIYSIGTILYELLSGGKFPFGKVENLDFRGEMPEYQSLMKIRNDVPEWLDLLIRKAVHWDLSHRFGALSELLFALEHPGEVTVVQENQPIIKRKPVTFWKWVSFIELGLIIFFFYLWITSR